MAFLAFEPGQAALSRPLSVHSAPVRAMAASVAPCAIAGTEAARLGGTARHSQKGIIALAVRLAGGLQKNTGLSGGQPFGSWPLDTRYSVSERTSPQRVALV